MNKEAVQAFFRGISPEGAFAMLKRHKIAAIAIVAAAVVVVTCTEQSTAPVKYRWLVHDDHGKVVVAAKIHAQDYKDCAGIRIDGTAELTGRVPSETIDSLFALDYFDLILDELVDLPDSTTKPATVPLWTCAEFQEISIEYDAPGRLAVVRGLPVVVVVYDVEEYRVTR